MTERPAIVPIIDRDDFLLGLTQVLPGTRDLWVIREPADDFRKREETDGFVRQTGMPVALTLESHDYESLCDEDCLDRVHEGIDLIRELIEKYKYKRLLFLADEASRPGLEPLFARGTLGYDVQAYISCLLYDLGPYVTCF
jgi:hypothetical protein